MPGGIMPPLSVWLQWPVPNYINPETQPKYVLIFSCIIGPVSIALLFARLWVRIRIQRNPGWDDWLMLIALFPVIALTVLLVLVTEGYRMNRHVWDIEVHYFPTQRKFTMAIYTLFSLSSGLIKMSVLFFYRRLSSRAVSPAFRWLLRITIASIAVYTLFFVFIPFFMCRPMAAFWDQTDFFKIATGYKFKCINEGKDVLANGIIATVQDLIAAFLPTLLCWNLQISFREKLALYSIFAFSYTTVIIGAMRTWAAYRLFFVTYDVTWVANELWLWCLLELHIGCMCANAPALKVFFSHSLGSRQWTGSRSKSRGPNDTNRTNRTARTNRTTSTFGSRFATMEKFSYWRRNIIPNRSGYMSEPHSNVTTDKCGGIIQTSSHHVSIEEERDVEMGEIHSGSFGNVSDVQALPPIATPKPSRWPLGRSNSPASQWTGESNQGRSVWRFWERR